MPMRERALRMSAAVGMRRRRHVWQRHASRLTDYERWFRRGWASLWWERRGARTHPALTLQGGVTRPPHVHVHVALLLMAMSMWRAVVLLLMSPSRR